MAPLTRVTDGARGNGPRPSTRRAPHSALALRPPLFHPGPAACPCCPPPCPRYRTHALGKWDVGYYLQRCTPTLSGFDTFLGYYEACLADYWYHWAPSQCDHNGPYVDLSNSTTGANLSGAALVLNGTYNAEIFTAETIRLIEANDGTAPLFFYLAYQNVHLACGSSPRDTNVKSGKPHGLQARCETVDLYPNTIRDIDKLQAAMVTELDYGVGNVTAALRTAGIYDNTVVVLVADNGAQLDHGYNAPLRGGKHTFWEGGVRVVCFVSSPLLPAAVRGTQWNGMAHSSDWYVTLVQGVAGGPIPNSTGPRDPDGVNLWPALMAGAASPRTEVVHQVANEHYDAAHGISFINGTVVSSGDCDGSCGVAIRVGDMKLIVGHPGDQRYMAFPGPGTAAVPFGQTGGLHEDGTNHCRAPPDEGSKDDQGNGVYLFNLTADVIEAHNLAQDPAFTSTVERLRTRLAAVGKDGPPPAYLFPTKDTLNAAAAAVCRSTERTGFLQPGDLFPSPPAPPAPPGNHAHAKMECTSAGGILDDNTGHVNPGEWACCAKTCGVCGGKHCGDNPGGDDACCSGEIAANGKPCDANPAPCVAS